MSQNPQKTKLLQPRELMTAELKYLKEINESPVIFRWKYNLDAISLT